MTRIFGKLLVGVAGIVSGLSWAGPDVREQAASAAADAALKRLKVTLMEKMEQGGPGTAIPFCHASAVPVTTAEVSGQVVSVRRATLRARNPVNQAQADEAEILKDWQAKLSRGEAIPASFARSEGKLLHYYRPIRLDSLCLSCHGSPQQIPAEVKATLAKHYPKDQATGYAAGDLRGLIHVVVR